MSLPFLQAQQLKTSLLWKSVLLDVVHDDADQWFVHVIVGLQNRKPKRGSDLGV